MTGSSVSPLYRTMANESTFIMASVAPHNEA